MNTLLIRLRETLFAVLPITGIVLLLHWTWVPLSPSLLYPFLLGSVLIVIGLALFLIGVDIGITPMGEITGDSIAKTNKLWIVVAAGLILGFVISIAEPGLLVFGHQVNLATQGQIGTFALLFVVSIGLATFVSLGLVRILFNTPLHYILLGAYSLIFVLALFSKPEFLAIAFDASGATTGVLAVPFILALSVGISVMKKDSKSSEKDSFGLIAIASAGAIISVLILGMAAGAPEMVTDTSLELDETLPSSPFRETFESSIGDSVTAMAPLLGIFLFLQKASFRLKRREFRRIIKGFIYAVLGLFLFLWGANAGFMQVGAQIGSFLTTYPSSTFLLITAFVLGFVTILAEPAVYVLTRQIEEVTAGYIKRPAVLAALSIGVGLAVLLSAIRISVPSVQLWHYLLPGYMVCLLLPNIVPKLFVGIAFDAGGVATGPMTATFILAFVNGAASAQEGANLLVDGFGMIATVAMIPIITLQILGLLFKVKTRKDGIAKHEH